MPINILYIIDPIETINPNSDTTYSLMLESQKRGYNNYICQIDEIGSNNNQGFTSTKKIIFDNRANEESFIKSYTLSESKQYNFADFKVIWMRKDPPVDRNFLTATMLLDNIDRQKTLVINEPQSLRIANEKLWCLSNFSEFMPQTIVSCQQNILLSAAKKLDKFVLKPIYEAGGYGILASHKNDQNLNSLLQIMTDNWRKHIIIQSFIEEIKHGDKRIILLGGDPIGAVLRIPPKKDFRANLHIGGMAKKCDISEHDMSIIKRLKPMLLKFGLHFVGIDIVGKYLTEINITSPTGIQEIHELNNNLNLPSSIWNYVEKQVAKL